MSTYHYMKCDDLFQLVDGETGEILVEGAEVAIVVNRTDFVIHKHGMLDKVQKWYDTTRQRYIANGLERDAAELLLISSSQWDPVELNKILEITGYIKCFLERLSQYQAPDGPLLLGEAVASNIDSGRPSMMRVRGQKCCHSPARSRIVKSRTGCRGNGHSRWEGQSSVSEDHAPVIDAECPHS